MGAKGNPENFLGSDSGTEFERARGPQRSETQPAGRLGSCRQRSNVPTSFVLGGKQAQGQGGVIAENNPNMTAKGLASNGTGIDHAEDVYGAAVVGLILRCGGSLGGPA